MNQNEIASGPATVLEEPWHPAATPASEAGLGRQTAIQVPRFVQVVFWLSVFAIPFTSLYVPGTGDRIGVVRIVQVLVFLAMLCQPTVCLRHWPIALSWFFGYCLLRITWGLWMTPQLAEDWWPSTFDLMQFSLPWLLFLFNVLRLPGMPRKGLWALALGVFLCATLHLAGIGVYELDLGLEGRTSIFRENANVVGTMYGLGIITMVGLLALKEGAWWQRIILIGMIPVAGLALAMTGSRTAAIIVMCGLLILLCQSQSLVSSLRGFMILLVAVSILGAAVYTVPTVLKRFDLFRSKDPRSEPRARMVPVLWEMYLRHPVLGSGPSEYVQELTHRAMPYLVKKNRTISSHNFLLLLLVETGLVGFLVFARGFGMALASGWRARRTIAGRLPLALLLPLAISGATSSDPHYQAAFWFAMAFALAGRS